MSRKAPILFLILTMVSALSALVIYAAAHAAGEEDPAMEHTLIFATDLHYLAPELTDRGAYFTHMIETADGKVTAYIDELTDAFLAQVIDIHPDALILSGDVSFNGARPSHEALAAKLAAVRAAGVPVLVMPGNHDLYNTNAARFSGDGFTRIESVTAEDFAAIYAGCGFSEALSRDAASLSYVYELSPALRILMLDVNTEDAKQWVKDETLAWVEGQLADAAASGARVIAVSHQNVYRHNAVIYESYVIKNSGALLALYETYGVPANFSGHLHCQHIVRGGNGFTEIATSSLAVYPNQFGVVTLMDDELCYETIPTDVSGWAKARGLTDPNLLDFASYSLTFFQSAGRAQTAGSSPEADAFLARLNTAYFSGRMDTVDPNDPGFDLWRDAGFFTVYVDSLRADIGKDFTHAEIPLG